MARPIKWTPERAEELAKQLDEWFMADESRVFWKSFFDVNKLDPDLIQDLQSVSPAFSRTIKSLEALQERRLVERGMNNKANVAMAIFVLKNKHGYADKMESRVEQKIDQTVTANAAELTPEQLRQRIFLLTEQSNKSN